MGLIAELRRRNVFRIAALYVVAAWLIMQVAEVVVTLGALPVWTGQVLLVVLAVGFPIALILSWIYELTPEGITLEKDDERHESIRHVTGRRMDFIVISLLCAALLVFAADKWWPTDSVELSIAVLPFVNMSDDPEQEYFSDGLSEDILNLLVKIPELRVTSRSSAFSFKRQEVDVPTIASKLNVSHILEGSVRKSGDKLRITAQLIQVESDMNLWSQTYDRELEKIFAIQDEIAAAVVDALKITLLGDSPTVSATDSEVYALYLQGRHFADQGGNENNERAKTLLKQALEIDSNFSPAWTELGRVYASLAGSEVNLRGRDEAYELARDALKQALAIDPKDGRAFAVLGDLEIHYDWDFEAADQYMQRALALSPGDAFVLILVAHLETIFGRHDEALDMYRRLAALDPVSPRAHNWLGSAYYFANRLEEAADSFQLGQSLSLGGVRPLAPHALVLLAQGDAPGALEIMEQQTSEVFRLWGTAIVQHALENFEASGTALRKLIDEYGRSGGAVQVAEVYAFRGDVDRAFEWLDQAYINRDSGLPFMLGRRLLDSLHDDPRWESLLDKMGLPH